MKIYSGRRDSYIDLPRPSPSGIFRNVLGILPTNGELREIGSFELREDHSFELRE